MRDLLAKSLRDSMVDAEVITMDVPVTADDIDGDLVLMDLDLGPSVDTPAFIRSLTARGMITILMSAAGTSEEVQESLRAGAATFVSKGAGLNSMDAAVRNVLSGRRSLSSDLAGRIATPVIDGVTLTAEQQRAMLLHSTGMGNESIAATLGRTTADLELILTSALAAYRGA